MEEVVRFHQCDLSCGECAVLMRCSGGSGLELEKTTTGLNRTVESSDEMLHQVANTINAGISSGHHNQFLAGTGMSPQYVASTLVLESYVEPSAPRNGAHN